MKMKTFRNALDTVTTLFVLVSKDGFADVEWYMNKLEDKQGKVMFHIVSYDEFNLVESQAFYLEETYACTDFFDIFKDDHENLDIMSWDQFRNQGQEQA